jgi:hypothetical protein
VRRLAVALDAAQSIKTGAGFPRFKIFVKMGTQILIAFFNGFTISDENTSALSDEK